MTTPVIVVGVDGTPGGRRALDWALAEAVRRGAVLKVVSAWAWDGLESPIAVTSPGEARERAEQIQTTQTEEALADSVARPVLSREVVEGPAAQVLVEAARDADFLVVGSRGYGPVRAWVMGSVSLDCIRHASCPVVIVPVPHVEKPRHEALALQGTL